VNSFSPAARQVALLPTSRLCLFKGSVTLDEELYVKKSKTVCSVLKKESYP